MKKTLVIFLLLFAIAVTAGCSSEHDNGVQSTVENDVSVNQEKVRRPIYANEVKDGTYEITVDSSSSMFRVVKCELIVDNEEMRAVMTMSGKGYGMVYMGTSEKALVDSEDAYIPFVLNENGQKTFTVPIEALNKETECAAWSIKKEKWYDRTLIFESDAIEAEALNKE